MNTTTTNAMGMNLTEATALLEEYGRRDVGSSEKTLAAVAVRWIRADPSAVTDPLLTDLFARAKAPPPTRKSNILDYFGTSSVSQKKENVGVAFDNSYNHNHAHTHTHAHNESAFSSLFGNAESAKTRHRIYCDGACSANGRRGARAGYGASLQDSSGKELEAVSAPLDSVEPQTNQRAELRALQWAFTKAMSLPEGADIHTDSEYALKCFTEWGPLWAAKGWRKVGGGEVLHQDILRPMWEIWKTRGSKIKLFHVSAHTGGRDIHSLGNARADTLAVASLQH